MRRRASCGRAGVRSDARWRRGRSAFAPARGVVAEARQRGLDALAETRVHRLFLLLSLVRTHQKERLAPIRAGADLGFDPVAHLPPVPPIGELDGERLQLALARADQIAPLAGPQPGDGLGARHAAVHHPDAARLAVAALHRGDDLLDSRHVGAIAGEHLVAERYAVTRHDEANADLLAVAPMIAAVAAAGEPWPRLGPRNRCSSRHRATARSRARTTRPADA